MGCGCRGAAAKAPTTYSYTSPDGQTTTTYSTKLEANAAQVRAGGGGTVQPVQPATSSA